MRNLSFSLAITLAACAAPTGSVQDTSFKEVQVVGPASVRYDGKTRELKGIDPAPIDCSKWRSASSIALQRIFSRRDAWCSDLKGCYAGDAEVAKILVGTGLALAEPDGPYAETERWARASLLGLWGDECGKRIKR